MDAAPFLTGGMLLAMPGIGDPRFERAAILMCAHDAGGALGVGLGARLPDLRLRALIAGLGVDPGAAPDGPVHAGGPVEPRRGFVVHSRDWSGADTVDVAGRVGLTGTIDVLRAIAAGRGPSRFVVALGYAGWAAGQLDDELARPGWVTAATVSEDTIFDAPAEARWAAALRDGGIDPAMLAAGFGSA